MKRFIQRFPKEITGVLSGFDRLVLHGTLRRICYVVGMKDFLWHNGVLLKDFGNYAFEITKLLKSKYKELADGEGIPFQYISSSKANKEAIALKIGEKTLKKTGPIAILSSLEPANSYDIHRDRERKEIQLVIRERKCLHFYYYFVHPEFGLMNARIQSWFPFNIQICINGREWLSRQMDKASIAYRRLDNCFVEIEDFHRAQRLMTAQVKTNWRKKLDGIGSMLNPIHKKIFQKYPLNYYWSIPQNEWATDLVFKNRESLAAIYPALILHGITNLRSEDVMRFLAKRLHGNFEGEVMTDFKKRPEGVRIKHRVGKNSVKLYDKYGRVLRVEMTLHDSRAMKVFRPKENQPNGRCTLTYLRKGIADIERRANLCQSINERYLDALSCVEPTTQLGELLQQISKPTKWKGRSVRALRPWASDDKALLEAVARGEFTITDFRNRDLQLLLFKASPQSDQQKRQRSSKVSRLLQILRAHHILRSIPCSYRYMVTSWGRDLLNAIFSSAKMTIEQIQNAAA